MRDIVLVFEVHQPARLARNFKQRIRELAAKGVRITPDLLEHIYFDEELNRRILERVSRKCYLPANEVILQQLDNFRHSGKKFKVSFSLSGVFLEQARKWVPEVLESFQRLSDTGLVEFLDQTYYHSLASLLSEEEFTEQVLEHRQLMKDYFGREPTSVENTEFIYNTRIACVLGRLGYKVVLTEGVERILGWRSPNYLYKARGCGIKVLMRNYRLSDDIGFRFASREWSEYPLTADKYAAWLAATPGDVILIAVDYETFGEHFPRETGIFEFLRWLPGEVLKWENLRFATPSEVADSKPVRDEIEVPEAHTISWADIEKDISAWLGNELQRESFERLRHLRCIVRALPQHSWKRVWKLLSTSDHLYYMSTKTGGPGEVHAYFSHFATAYEAYAAYLEVVSDFEARAIEALLGCERARVRYAWMRDVPAGQEFFFYEADGKPAHSAARNMFEFADALAKQPASVAQYHQERGDFASWVESVVGDLVLAQEFRKVGVSRDPEETKARLLQAVEARRREIFEHDC
ncbi:MAG: glycoside hydrolase family 57 protein [Thermofilum sp.]